MWSVHLGSWSGGGVSYGGRYGTTYLRPPRSWPAAPDCTTGASTTVPRMSDMFVPHMPSAAIATSRGTARRSSQADLIKAARDLLSRTRCATSSRPSSSIGIWCARSVANTARDLSGHTFRRIQAVLIDDICCFPLPYARATKPRPSTDLGPT